MSVRLWGRSGAQRAGQPTLPLFVLLEAVRQAAAGPPGWWAPCGPRGPGVSEGEAFFQHGAANTTTRSHACNEAARAKGVLVQADAMAGARRLWVSAH